VAPAVHDAVVVGQELLLVAEVRLERLRLLLRLEATRLAHDGRVEAAQGELPSPGEHTLRPVRAPAVSLREHLVHGRQDPDELWLALATLRLLRQGERGLDLVLVEAPDALCNARSAVEPRDDSRAVALEAVDRVRCCGGILLGLLDVRVLLPEELLFLDTEALLCLCLPSLEAPLSPLPLSGNDKVPDVLLFGEEGLDSTLPPRAALGLPRWLLLMLLRHVHFQGVLRPGEAAIAEAAREGWMAA
jgi:hypothetical protein